MEKKKRIISRARTEKLCTLAENTNEVPPAGKVTNPCLHQR